MAIVNQVAKKVVLPRWEIVQFQIVVHCYLNSISISTADLDCLTHLGVFKSPQSARNALSKAEKKGLIIKQGKSKKKIAIHPNVNIQTEGNILLDYKFAHIESQKAQASN